MISGQEFFLHNSRKKHSKKLIYKKIIYVYIFFINDKPTYEYTIHIYYVAF